MITHGIILELEQCSIIKHSLLNIQDSSKLLSTITYAFMPEGDTTVLIATEELNYDVTDDELNDLDAGLDIALKLVKGIAESL